MIKIIVQNSVGREVWIVEERMTRIYNQQIATMEDNNLKARRKMEVSTSSFTYNN